MKRGASALLIGAAANMTAMIAFGASAPLRRIEAQSESYRAVGFVDGERMTVRLSRVQDNAPVADAAVNLTVRAHTQPAVAQPDGSYQARISELTAPGESIIAINVTRAGAAEKLVGTLAAPDASKATDPAGRTRQLLWWVLNFGVCIGFLLLISRRKKARSAEAEED